MVCYAIQDEIDSMLVFIDRDLQSGRWYQNTLGTFRTLALISTRSSSQWKPERRRMLSEKGMRKIAAVIGDIMIDRYVTGRVDRISPEAPVPILLHSHDRTVAGGAANVAVNILALGCDVRLVGAIGNDKDADDLKNILAEKGISTTLLVTDSSRPTISKTRVVSG